MRFNIFILFAILLITCEGNYDIKKHHNLAKEFRNDNNYGKAIIELRTIVNKYPNSNEAAQSQFKIAEIYLNDIRDYDFAIKEFLKLINLFPNNKITPKALFMIGYTYGNHLDAYSHALKNYRKFLTEYPKHELIPSVEYEINELLQYESVIDSLNKIALINEEENIWII